MKKFALGTMVAALVSLVAPRASLACSCLPPPDIVGEWGAMPNDVVAVKVLGEFELGAKRYYRTRVLRVFKGCMQRGTLLLVATNKSTAACGLDLHSASAWLLATKAKVFFPYIALASMTSCDVHKPLKSLTKAEISWLRGRMVCCGGSCSCADGSQPVDCLVDPCEVASCPQGSCTANYCGGCKAEFFTNSGALVCLPCSSDADCPAGQTCSSSGQCLVPCTSDADCAAGFWCRPTMGGGAQCVPYQQEGESCGGLLPPEFLLKCAPGLVCTDFPPFVLDAPGTCRKPCDTNADCAQDQYCGSGGVCRDDGTCKVTADCNVPGNSYIAPKCLGYGVCTGGQCGWECGPQACADVGGIDFGACEMVLGWAVVDGTCQLVSGCSDQGHPFFGSQKECEKTCPGVCIDLGGQWFGPCDTVLGWGVVGGKCVAISGCDAFGQNLFASKAACNAACFGACTSDADCPAGEWCRPTIDGATECVPYQQEGESCGGFTPPFAQLKCAPGLVCTDFPPGIADLPGVCRKPCKSDANCAADQYCAADGVCRADGTCKVTADCNVPGNTYNHIKCLGYGVCTGGQCGWECGPAECADVGGIDFGLCDMVLGWAVVDGTCQLVSGCGDQGHAFFASQKECEKTCPGVCVDLGGEWFGACDMVLGWGVAGGKCVAISGCDAGGQNLFATQAACVAACFGACTTDADCPTGEWCRPTIDGGTECVPYQQEGESCGGFTPPFAQLKCAPGLVCTDFPPYLADAPGVCRKPCKSDTDCAADQYCASDGMCRADGTCKVTADCNAPGNGYVHVMCLGYGVCTGGQCGWQCGNPGCADIGAIDFGSCKMLLGWGIVDGTCQSVGGCDAQGHPFFGSQAECEKTCPGTCADLAGEWFGPCDMLLGWGVVGSKCIAISGCDAGGQNLFASQAACQAACGSGPLTP